ncbi:MAG: potassium channel family protein [Angustibacter sp.]
MHCVIMGCGRVGSMLARSLVAAGHEVAVIDQRESAFRRLGEDFPGTQITGVGFERDVLRAAGIERAEAFAAVSSGDNSNILSARVARETFGVANVVARIYDPGRAAISQRLGIPTVATVSWTTDQIIRRLLPAGAAALYREPSGQVILAELPVNPAWIGHHIDQLQDSGPFRVAWISRLGQAVIPSRETILQEGDLVHVAVAESDLPQAERAVTAEPRHDD